MTIREAFAGVPRMGARVAVYVPGTVDAATADAGAAERMTERAAARLSELFGGATIQPAAGAWVSEARGLIREAVNIVYSFAEPETLNRSGPAIRELAEQIKRDMQQEAVSVEINGALYLV